MIKSSEIKIAQRFVILAYQRYRLNRKWLDSAGKWLDGTMTINQEYALNQYAASKIEAWNHLQIAKEIYYDMIYLENKNK